MPEILDQRLRFPDPRTADGKGLVAIGGDLSAARLRLGYRRGMFPWTVNPVTWWSPDPRAIFELEQFHVPHRLAKFIRKQPFEITRDCAFRQVMQGCAVPAPGRGQTWVMPEFVEAYTCLHEQGDAHSVECWRAGELVGGIYGVSFGGFFAGESMFHRATNASKVALCHLVGHLRARGFVLFDVQMITPATRQLGAVEIPRETYLMRLKAAVQMNCPFG
jgi:leucyl/phenylalanyl-tRNA---protein transferase